MATIAKMAAVLTLNQSKFASGLKGAGAKLKGFALGVAKLGLKIGAIGAALGAAVAGVGFSMLIKNQFKLIESAVFTAEKLGLEIDKLQGLQFAAQQSGIRIETFNMALQRMTRRVAEASIGTGEAKDAIAELGLDAKELANLPTDQALLKVAEAMKKVENPARKLRLAFKLFDSEGVTMISLLNEGSEGIKEFMRRADELGLTVDALAGEKIIAANEAFGELKAVFTGLARSIAVQLAPFLALAAEKMTEFVESTNSLGAIQKVFDGIATAVQKIIQFSTSILIAWKQIQITLTEVGLYLAEKLFKAMKKIVEMMDSLPGISGGMDETSETFMENFIEGSKDRLEGLRKDVNVLLNEGIKAQERMADRAKEWADNVEKGAKAAAAARQGRSVPDLPTDLGGKPAVAKGPRSFAQISRATTALGGVGGKIGRVPIEGDPEQTEALNEIARNTEMIGKAA